MLSTKPVDNFVVIVDKSQKCNVISTPFTACTTNNHVRN